MSKDRRSALLDLANGSAKLDTIPAAFFLHFDSVFHSGQAAIEKHKEFFRFTGMDLVKIQFEVDFPRIAVDKPSDWQQIPRLDKDLFRPQLDVVRGLVQELGAEAPVVLTLYSPLMIAATIGDQDTLNRHLEENFEAVRPAMEQITEDLAAFVADCIEVGLDGFYHSTQGAEERRFTDPSVFDRAVKPYDLQVMREIDRRCRFNILHICDYHRDAYGGYPVLARFKEYPGHIVNCSLDGKTPQEVSDLLGRPFMGGMDRRGPLATGTAEEARHAATESLAQASDRYILAADCTVPANTPWENLRAAIDAAHGWKR